MLYFPDLLCCQLVETEYSHHFILESSFGSKGVSLRRPPGKSLSMAGCPLISFPPSTRSFLGSSVLIGLEPSPNLSYTNVQVGQRDCPSSHRIRLPQLYRAQKRRRKTRNMRCEHTQGCAVETDLSSLGANLMRGAGGSGARLENGGGPGGTSPCSDAPLLLLPAPHPVTWWGNHSCPLLEPTDNLNAATSCSSCHSKPGELAL